MKRLFRSPSDRMLFGVCGGMGEYLGVDANLVRLAWIVSVLVGGVGVVPYVVAVMIVPEGEGPRSSPDWARVAGVGIIGLGIYLLLRVLDISLFAVWSFRVLIPAALIVAGIFLVWPRTREALGLSSGDRARRSVTDRVIAGVCGGLARKLQLDGNLVRILFVFAATLSSGFFLLVYLLLVVVLPEEEIPIPAATAPATGAPPPPPGTPPATGSASPPPGAPPATGTASPPPAAPPATGPASPPPGGPPATGEAPRRPQGPADDPEGEEPPDEGGQGVPGGDR